MKPIKLKDNADVDLRRRVDAAMAGQMVEAFAPLTTMQTTAKIAKVRQPNKTEAEFANLYLRGVEARYEALTWRMANGSKYTPDWVVFVDGLPTACVECKGSYRFASHGRSKLAWSQCAVEFPGIEWVFAVKTKDGWKQETKGGK